MYNDNVGWRGRIRVTSKYRDGTVEVQEFDNLITDAGRNLLRDTLTGTVNDARIKFLAWGTGTAPANESNVQLAAEAGRKAVTKQNSAGVGVAVTTVYLAPFDANIQIEELGWFAGASATETPNSGVMVARVLFSKLKTNLESIQVDRTDTLS